MWGEEILGGEELYFVVHAPRQSGGVDTCAFLFRRSPFAHSSVMYRASVARAVNGYDDSLPRAKDLDIFFKLARFGRFGFVKGVAIKYREVDPAERDFLKNRLTDAQFQLGVL